MGHGPPNVSAHRPQVRLQEEEDVRGPHRQRTDAQDPPTVRKDESGRRARAKVGVVRVVCRLNGSLIECKIEGPDKAIMFHFVSVAYNPRHDNLMHVFRINQPCAFGRVTSFLKVLISRTSCVAVTLLLVVSVFFVYLVYEFASEANGGQSTRVFVC